MAITVNSTGNSNGQPSAPLRMHTLNVDLDASYPTGGYDVSASLPDGATIVASPKQSASDGTTPILVQLVNDAGTPKVKCFVEATGAEQSAAANLSAYTGIEVMGVSE